MILWRISNHADLQGIGGIVSSARWHTQGRRIVYLAGSPSAAMLEILVHDLDLDHLPATYRLLKIEAQDEIASDSVDLASLPANWTVQETVTRAHGDSWLRDGKTALLRVPSAIMPETTNCLLNPLHPDAARVRITASTAHAYNARFWPLKSR